MTASARPRFRTDLVAEPIQDGNQRFVDVFDPDSGRGFRFYEVEYSLACAMDGERDVAGLARWAREELGVEPSTRELATVITTLGDLGYLTGGARADVGELAAGVVAAQPSYAAGVEQVELGTAGAVPQARGELPPAAEVELGQAGGVSTPRIVVDDFGAGPDLGKDDFPAPPPAAQPVAALQRRTVPDQDHDGPTDLPRPVPLAAGDEDVSTDLSDHLAISASDVKEAVRASRVMQAVELPADIAATLAAAEAEQEARAAADKAAAEQAAADKAAAEQAAAEQARREAEAREAAKAAEAADKAAADKAAAEAADKAAAEKAAAERELAAAVAADKAAQAVVRPVDVADKAAAAAGKAAKTGDTATAKLPPKEPGKTAAKTPVEPPAEPRTSRALIFLLVLTILLAGAYLVWTQILKKPLPWEKAEPTATAPVAPAPTPPPAPPPPPPAPSSSLTEAAGATTDVAGGKKGTLAEVVAAGTTVAAGDVIARFQAPAALTKQLAANRKRLDVDLPKALKEMTAQLEAATAANKAEPMKTWQARIDKQAQVRTAVQAEVDSLTQQLDAFAIKAPLAGTVTPKLAKGAKVTNEEQVIASITAPTMLVAKFTPNAGRSYQVGDAVQVAPQGGGGATVGCKVAAVEGTTVTVECPSDGTLAAGTTVTLP